MGGFARTFGRGMQRPWGTLRNARADMAYNIRQYRRGRTNLLNQLDDTGIGWTPLGSASRVRNMANRAGRAEGARLAELAAYAQPVGWNRDLARSFTRRGWGRAEVGRRWSRGFRSAGAKIGLGINLAVGVGGIIGNTAEKSAEWGTTSGHTEDYIGGAVYGFGLGRGRAFGSLAGEAIGTVLGSFLGPWGAFAGSFAGQMLGADVSDYFFQRGAYERGLSASYATAGAIAKRKVQFGRGFKDTQQAYTMRQAAVQEMSGSLLNARQYLGNEAYFLHS